MKKTLALWLALLFAFGLCAKKQSPRPLWPNGEPMSTWFSDTTKIDPASLGKRYVVTEHGVKASSTAVQTRALQAVIDLAAQEGGGVIVIPQGTFLSGSLYFRKGTHLLLEEGAVLKGSEHIRDFDVRQTRIEGQTCLYFAALVNADGADGFTIAGKGTIDGNGTSYWEAFWIRRRWNPDCTNKDEQRPRLVFVSNSSNVTIQDVRLANSPFWTTHIYRCDHVRFLDLSIYSPTKGLKGPSTDAIDIDACHDVVVRGCHMNVNDDAVVLKGGKGTFADLAPENGPNYNILVEKCHYGTVHGCITLGSESLHDWNIVLRDCQVDDAHNVLWLKMRPDTPQHYEHLSVENLSGKCGNFLLVKPWTQFYQREERDSMPLSQCNDMRFTNIRMQCRRFFNVEGSEKYALRNFTFQNIDCTEQAGGEPFAHNPILHLKLEKVTVNGRQATAEPADQILCTARLANARFMFREANPACDSEVKGRRRSSNLWTRGVYYEGLMALHAIDPNPAYINYTDQWANHHRWTARNGTRATNADDQCCQQTYLERYKATKDSLMLKNVRLNLEHQMATGRTNFWTWIDAIQMSMPVYAQMSAITGEPEFIDYAMKAYLWTRNECGGGLFNAEEGLWWRDRDFVPPYKEKDGQNCYWSRGNGWVYAALVRVMNELGPDHPHYGMLLADFLLMSKALVGCQRSDGFWNVSLLSPSTYGGKELTGTALFLYGMAWGIRKGVLNDAAYRTACDKAWQGMAQAVHDDGFLGWVQETGKQPSDGQPLSYDRVPDFEDFGLGCFLLGACEYYNLFAHASAWPQVTQEAKAGTRWWWPGSAVDEDNLRWNLEAYGQAGIGTVEITPIYGVQGNEGRELPFLSSAWMKALQTTQDIARGANISVDMNCGTGWPFGGPQVEADEAACKALFVIDSVPPGTPVRKHLDAREQPHAKLLCERRYALDKEREMVIQLFQSRTRQKVKRAAPGGEGWVVDHFDRKAVGHYLQHIAQAFEENGTPYPRTFFNDSYEVYGANWTPTLLDEFAQRRGYRLEDNLRQLLGLTDDGNQVLSDYRETLSDLLLENFTKQWTAWAHSHQAKVRNQAHGSPANLLDLYAAVDVPETEGFGLTDFGIRGLRTDPGMTRRNFSDISMLKYASSAAHVTGKQFTSSETFTWLTEHFRTSLSQMKPDLDLLFTCGINRVFFHGSCYSPKDAPWPGWRFYASVDMTPANSIWRDLPYLTSYIQRCQSFLQMGQPDNDFLVYLPVRDMWHQRLSPGERGLLMQFDIHSMAQKAPQFIKSILRIDSLGYDCDYISDRQLAQVTTDGHQLVTEGGTRYRGLIIPTGTTITPQLKEVLSNLSPFVIYGEDEVAMARLAQPEPMRRDCHLRALRRHNADGHHYFIANLTANDVDALVPLATGETGGRWFNPLTGDITTAEYAEGRLRIRLRSGGSRILQTGNSLPSGNDALPKEPLTKQLAGPWQLSFSESTPQMQHTYKLQQLQTWEQLDDTTRTLMGTGIYETHFDMPGNELDENWAIELGDVRESARVYLNGQFLGCAWAVPFVLPCRDALRQGDNHLLIEVTNLPANRIAEMERRGERWRIMKDINVVDLNYRPSSYAGWSPLASGLAGPVRLVTQP